MSTSEAAIPRRDLPATGLEVTQGLQNSANSLRLIENKRTIVRFYARSGTGMDVAVTASFDDLGGSQWQLQDQFEEVRYDRDGSDLRARGLYVDALPWQASVFTLTRGS